MQTLWLFVMHLMYSGYVPGKAAIARVLSTVEGSSSVVVSNDVIKSMTKFIITIDIGQFDLLYFLTNSSSVQGFCTIYT